jgi:hypothetical protein
LEVDAVFGVDWSDPATLELNLTNLLLGILTLACIAFFIWSIALETFRSVKRAAVTQQDDHMIAVPGLGLTMADGGEKIEDAEKK